MLLVLNKFQITFLVYRHTLHLLNACFDCSNLLVLDEASDLLGLRELFVLAQRVLASLRLVCSSFFARFLRRLVHDLEVLLGFGLETL